MSDTALPHESNASFGGLNLPPWAFAVIPTVLLVAVLGLIIATNAGLGDRTTPPIETLNIENVRLPEPGVIDLSIINDGPDAITIAQVMVDDAYWAFETSSGSTLDRLDSTTVTIPYPWVEGEAHAINLVSSSGVMFPVEIPVATESPQADAAGFWQFGLIGFYVGLVPVSLGLLWFPFLKSLGRTSMNFILALTVGLLIYLVVDMFGEAQKIALGVAGSFSAPLLLPLLALLTTALLFVVSNSLKKRKADGQLTVSYQIATGIGLHNLGEGLAIGGAFALGEVALGVFLIIGFTLHNVTEGIGIAAPIVRSRPKFFHFVLLALVGGGPAIIGTWIGAFVFSPLWTTIFLAIGVGAIIQVVIEVSRMVLRDHERHSEPLLTWSTFGGLTSGVAIMYATALFIAA